MASDPREASNQHGRSQEIREALLGSSYSYQQGPVEVSNQTAAELNDTDED